MAYKDPEDKRAYNAAYYAANREKLCAARIDRYLANRDKVLAVQAVYNYTHRKEISTRYAAWYAEHKEEACAYQAAYYAAHKKKVRVRSAAYYAAHKEEALAYCKAYSAEHEEEKRAYRAAHRPEQAARSSLRRAVIAGTMIGITIAQKAEIKEIYRKAKEDPKVRCYICDELIPLGDRHVDHIVPVSKGGPTRPSNLAVACSHCNMSKHDKHPNELGILV